MASVMEDDPNRFREYAAACKRLAERASERDREVLLEIAAAWLSCAEQADRKMHTAAKNK
jgi:hypothetical protein